jgi:hypothetical protein
LIASIEKSVLVPVFPRYKSDSRTPNDVVQDENAHHVTSAPGG